MVDAVRPPLRHVPQPPPRPAHASSRRRRAVTAPCAPGRFLGPRTQLVGVNMPSLHPVPWSLPRLKHANCWSAPTDYRHCTMGPGRFRGPGTQLVGANGAPLHVPPGTQLVDTIEPRSASRSCIDIVRPYGTVHHLVLGSAPLPEDQPFPDTFVCDDDALTCEPMVEWEYYTHHQKKSVAWFNPDLCVHCARQFGAGRRHKDLQDVYHVVLPICEACEANGLKHILRKLKPNGQQKLKNLKK
eukprot:jgi/Tetstr1/439667/TSEL_028086.t1